MSLIIGMQADYVQYATVPASFSVTLGCLSTIEKWFCTNNCDAVMYLYQPTIEMIIHDSIFVLYLIQYSKNIKDKREGGREGCTILVPSLKICKYPKLLCKL